MWFTQELCVFFNNDLKLAQMTLCHGHETHVGKKQLFCEVRTPNVPKKCIGNTFHQVTLRLAKMTLGQKHDTHRS